MKRIQAPEWKDWRAKLEDVGFVFHSLETEYWNSTHCYQFSREQIEFVEKVTNELHEMCIEAITQIIDKEWYSRLGISGAAVELIAKSWDSDQRSLYGRLDLAWDGGRDIRMLEYNADTPTSIIESAVAQWMWMKDVYPKADQFNCLHEKFIARWKDVANKKETLHFTCLRESVEDICQTEYLRDTAIQAGFDTEFIFLDEIGYEPGLKVFADLDENHIDQLFKLYPWEWLLKEDFGKNISATIKLIEPPWKMLLSNKGLMPILWELHPNHPYLLPSFFEPQAIGKFVRKPLLSREGANIATIVEGQLQAETEGPYGEKYIYQKYHELPCFDGRYALTGSWIVGEEACGIGIREDSTPITQNLSQFVPHYFI